MPSERSIRSIVYAKVVDGWKINLDLSRRYYFCLPKLHSDRTRGLDIGRPSGASINSRGEWRASQFATLFNKLIDFEN